MSELKKLFLSEIPEFRKTGLKFINKELSRGDFKGISGGFGVYSHRDGEHFMIRLRVPSGVASLENLKDIYKIAKEYNLDKVHLTTRQAIQLHGLSIEDVCSVMKESINKGIYTRGGGGNFPRNVAMSPLSGVDKNEAFDVTPYALAVNEHFIKKITTYKLPRKLKVSFSSSNNDEGHCTIQDLGFLACTKDSKNYFRVYLGGGLGRNGKVAIEFDELVEPKDVLYHVEAMTNFFVAEGNYENKSKARIRYIVEKLGVDGFIKEYKKHLAFAIENYDLELNITPINYNKKGINTSLKNSRLIPQKQQGLYSVYFHPIGGQLSMDNFKLILDELEKIEKPMIRLSMTEGLYFINLNGEEAERILKVTKNLGGENKLEQSVSCIGVPICQMGVAESQSTLNAIIDYFKKNNLEDDILPSIHISGCPNSCGVHQVGEIGLTGKMKKVNNISTKCFELHIGGAFGYGKACLGEIYGDITEDSVPKMLYKLALEIKNRNITFDELINNNTQTLKDIINEYIV